jgi:ABC-2 type transport system permease protein
VHDPKVLILDEPTDGLDPVQKHEVRTLISEIAKEKTIVISTHILEEVDAGVHARHHHRARQAGRRRHAGRAQGAGAIRPPRRRVPRRRGLISHAFSEEPVLNPVRIILRRELASYFATPVAYVFIVIFLVLAGVCTFSLGALYESGQADLAPLFRFLPWLYLFLVPAVSMRLWAEERKTGSIELLLTQPVTLWQAVLGKFFAAWLFVGIALALTFPSWITINYLGNPTTAPCSRATSARSSWRRLPRDRLVHVRAHQEPGDRVRADVGRCASCSHSAGYPAVTEWSRGLFDWVAGWSFMGAGAKDVVQSIGNSITDGIASLSFLSHFENISKGVLALRDLLYFGLVITFFLLSSAALLEKHKSN